MKTVIKNFLAEIPTEIYVALATIKLTFVLLTVAHSAQDKKQVETKFVPAKEPTYTGDND